jgi:hypothetical protein
MRAMSEAAPRPPPLFFSRSHQARARPIRCTATGQLRTHQVSYLFSLSLPLPASQVVRAAAGQQEGRFSSQLAVASFEPQPGRKAPRLAFTERATHIHACMHARTREVSRAGSSGAAGACTHAARIWPR